MNAHDSLQADLKFDPCAHTNVSNVVPQQQILQEPLHPPQHVTLEYTEMKKSVKFDGDKNTENRPVKKTKNEKKKKEAIDIQAREIIFKVIRFFETEKQNRGYSFPVENVVKRACAATGLSESTIKRIKRDGMRAEATQTQISGPKKKRVRKAKIQLDYYQLCALRGIVNRYSDRKEVATLGKILAAAREELQYRGGKESLRLILLNKLGIKFKKCEKKIKKPPEEEPPQVQQMNNINTLNVMQHHPMQQMKPMENQCVYTMMPQVPPVSY